MYRARSEISTIDVRRQLPTLGFWRPMGLCSSRYIGMEVGVQVDRQIDKENQESRGLEPTQWNA